MIGAGPPITAHPARGGRPLDPDRPAPDPARPVNDPPDPPAPGLRAQLGATRDALKELVAAHLDLARAEFEEIKGEVARAAAMAGVVAAAGLLLGVLLPVGGLLFLGEWVFGSMGWGLLHGTELLLGVMVAAVLFALRVGGVRIHLLVAVLVGVAVALLVALGLPAVTAIDPGLRVAIALGIAAGLAAWPLLMAGRVARQGLDMEQVKARFLPTTTVDTTKESIEWAKARAPRRPGS